ncbi:MAG: hypothetical protein N2254_09900 [bacterium]|nr:hypothetical protein [bacterium]
MTIEKIQEILSNKAKVVRVEQIDDDEFIVYVTASKYSAVDIYFILIENFPLLEFLVVLN